MASVAEMDRVEPGDVIVADMTDPDWEPIMKRASAIVTDRGGRTCHAAIIARELGFAAEEALDLDLDTGTPAGRLVVRTIASLAEWEREVIVERTREGLAHARRQGRVGGRPRALSPVAVDAVKAALEARDRARCGPVAPSAGLYLSGVRYD